MSTISMGHATWQTELLKLRKRPATWVLAGILLVPVVVFEYLFGYRLIASGADLPDAGALTAGLLPGAFVGTTLMQLVSPFGAGVALVLATVSVGSEYSWRTWRTIATQRPGRGVLLSGKLLAIATTLGIVAGFTLAAGWASSLIVAGLLDAPQVGPSALEVLAGWAAAWLVLTTYALIGALAAVLMRTTGLAVGVALLYVLLFEQGLLTLPLPERAAELIAQATIGTNAFALATSFSDHAIRPGMTVPPPGQAVAVLLVYLVVLAPMAVVAFRRRPIP